MSRPVVPCKEEVASVTAMAHVGGFVAGLILVLLFRNRKTQQRVEERMSYPVGPGDYR